MGVQNIQGWKVKLYGLTPHDQGVDPEYLERAISLYRKVIAEAPADRPHYSVGYAIVHDCGYTVFVLIDYYQNENELVRHLYSLDKVRDGEATCHTPSGLSACVWEGEIIDFERRKWMEHVLKRSDNPDFGLYLASFASGEV